MTLAELMDQYGANGVKGNAGIIRLDAELRIISLDEAAGSLIGVAPESILGRKAEDVFSLGNLRDIMRNGISFSSQTVMSGERSLVCDYLPVVEEKKVTGGVLAVRPMRAAEGEKGADDLNELLRSTSAFMYLDYDGIIVVDRNGTVVMVNQSFAEVLDTVPQAMVGKHIHQAYPNSTPSKLPMVMETGKPEIGVHYMNGRDVFASRFPLVKDGKVIGAVGKIIFKDIREITLLANRLQSSLEVRTPARIAASKDSLFKYDINSIVGQSRPIAELKKTLLRVAQKNSNVLLRGESGTGKELFAHALHAASNRRYAPFVKVNCAAIPEHLLESELFGYAEGAFTGAKRGGQVGKFEQAHTGTIFLDEIGDMPLSMQVKLLRVLQEKELVPLGSTASRSVDVRIVAATNSNLENLVREGKFREDLYYRLNVVSFDVPPLRERKEDLYLIARNFIDTFNTEFGLSVQGLDAEAWEVIVSYDWPGNIRELRNVIESAFNVVIGPLIRREHLSSHLSQLSCVPPRSATTLSGSDFEDYMSMNLGKKNIAEMVDDMEKLLIDKALEVCHGNKLHAAQLLGISRPGLYKKLQKFQGLNDAR